MKTVVVLRCEKCSVEQDFAHETGKDRFAVDAPKYEQEAFLCEHAGHITALSLAFEKREEFSKHRSERKLQ